MAYATYLEIQSDFKDTEFSATTNVTIADVEGFVVEADALINSYVGSVYEVPVGSGDGLNLLKLLCRSLVAGRIKTILEVKQEQSKDANQSVRGVLLSVSQVMTILKDLQAKRLVLDGAESLASGGGFFSSNASNDIEPVMKKDTRQW